jgi:hypothetical protein
MSAKRWRDDHARSAGDEGVQFGKVIGLDGGHPSLEPVTVAMDHHLGEPADVAAQRGKLRVRGT